MAKISANKILGIGIWSDLVLTGFYWCNCWCHTASAGFLQSLSIRGTCARFLVSLLFFSGLFWKACFEPDPNSSPDEELVPCQMGNTCLSSSYLNFCGKRRTKGLKSLYCCCSLTRMRWKAMELGGMGDGGGVAVCSWSEQATLLPTRGWRQWMWLWWRAIVGDRSDEVLATLLLLIAEDNDDNGNEDDGG